MELLTPSVFRVAQRESIAWYAVGRWFESNPGLSSFAGLRAGNSGSRKRFRVNRRRITRTLFPKEIRSRVGAVSQLFRCVPIAPRDHSWNWPGGPSTREPEIEPFSRGRGARMSSPVSYAGNQRFKSAPRNQKANLSVCPESGLKGLEPIGKAHRCLTS